MICGKINGEEAILVSQGEFDSCVKDHPEFVPLPGPTLPVSLDPCYELTDVGPYTEPITDTEGRWK